jgi:dehydrogenase/reductase SDR family protein 12
MSYLLDRLKAAYQATAFGVYGYRHFTQAAYLAHAAARNVPYLPEDEDMSGKTVLVTGANAGLGRVVALELARRRASVTLLCRNAEAGAQAAQEIAQATGNPKVTCQRVDMSRPEDIRAFVQGWGQPGTARAHVDVLINNAGVLLNERTMTPEGLEATFATNTLGPYLLTEGLLSLPGGSVGRVITVSSGGAYTARLEGEGISTWHGRPYDGPTVYSQSKVCFCLVF